MLLERGIAVSYETIRRWTAKFAAWPSSPTGVARRCVAPVRSAVKIVGRKFWLWRAVDQHGVVLEEILQRKRDTRAARRLLVKLMKRYGFVPRRIVTGKLASYRAAKREVAPGLEQRSHKGLNNRAENSHLAFRKRERTRQGFRSAGGLPRFVSVHSAIRNHYSVPVSRRSAIATRYHRLEAFDAWKAAASLT